MSTYTLSLRIETKDFPELGSPLYPNDKVVGKASTEFKKEFKLFRGDNEVNRSTVTGVEELDTCNQDVLEAHFNFEKEVSKTYKFMGMDIDEDFNAVIKIGSGAIVVANMADYKNKFIHDRTYNSNHLNTCMRYLDDYKPKAKAEDVLNRMGEYGFRRILTGFKCGDLFTAIKKISKGKYPDNLFKELEDYCNVADDNSSPITSNSIIISIVTEKEKSKQNLNLNSYTSTKKASDESEKDVPRAVLRIILSFWADVLSHYKKIKSIAAALDMWSVYNKEILQDDVFNSRFKNCCKIIDNSNMSLEERVVSFSGVSKNHSIYGDIYEANEVAETISDLGKYIIGERGSTSKRFTDSEESTKNLFTGMVDDMDLDDKSSLSLDELQAFSSLDSLRYADDDAVLSKSSYNMNDPYDRALYVKSAIRSYEKNFRDFKPEPGYDVSDTLANVVDTIGVENAQVISIKDEVYGSPEDVVTLTPTEMKLGMQKRDLLKVVKLVKKISDKLLQGFVVKP